MQNFSNTVGRGWMEEQGFAHKVCQGRWWENGGQWGGGSTWVSGGVLMGPEAALQSDGCSTLP